MALFYIFIRPKVLYCPIHSHTSSESAAEHWCRPMTTRAMWASLSCQRTLQHISAGCRNQTCNLTSLSHFGNYFNGAKELVRPFITTKQLKIICFRQELKTLKSISKKNTLSSITKNKWAFCSLNCVTAHRHIYNNIIIKVYRFKYYKNNL